MQMSKGENKSCSSIGNQDLQNTILSINLGNFGSTGTIINGISKTAVIKQYKVYQAYPNNKNCRPKGKYDIIICSGFFEKIYQKLAFYTGYNGCFSILATLWFLTKVNKISPNIVHLHNLHNSYINLPLLFKYIKKYKIPVIWTLHDCWAFTGQCPYFTLVKCEKWKTGCHDCPQFRSYPSSYVDRTKLMYKLKKKWFTGVKNMTIVTPSQWLAGLVKQSFLKDYPVRVINNGIDLSIFKPMPNDFRNKYRIPEDKHIVLGVAFGWEKRKGLDVFIALSQKLDSKKYQIVLVGTNDAIDKLLPKNIISIHRTEDQSDLARMYTSADVFVNPTREETFGIVNIEALACGTPVVTFNTGGSPECIDETCGSIVPQNDIDTLAREVVRICETKPFSKDQCCAHARLFDKNDKYIQYIELYEKISKYSKK